MGMKVLRRNDNNTDRYIEGVASRVPGGYPGRDYFVNNITGATGNDGLSWDGAFAQVSEAITAAEAFRVTFASTNRYIRNRIFVQGTGTAYTAITALPNYCDMIGVGADPRGNGTGIASITGSSSAAVTSTGVRGLYLENMQFIGSGSYYAMALAICFRSDFFNCAFVNGATGGLDITTGGGIWIHNCHIGGDTVTPATGLRVGSAGGNFNQCLVEDCMIYGSTTGIENDAYLCDGTLFRNNTVYGGTKGIDDNSTESTLAGNAFYVNNFIGAGSDAMEISQNGTLRCIGNICNAAGVTQTEDKQDT